MKTFRKKGLGKRGILGTIGGFISGYQGQRSRTSYDNLAGVNLNAPGSLEALLMGTRARSQSDVDSVTEALRGIRTDANILPELRQQLEGVSAQDVLSGRFKISGELRDQILADNKSSGRLGTIEDVLSQTTPGGQIGFIEQQFNRIRDFEKSPEFLRAQESQRDLARLLETSTLEGPLATQQDILAAQDFAQDIFAPRQVALQQQLEDARTQSQRNRAIIGRSAADPVLEAKLFQQSQRAQDLIGAEQGSLAAQFAQSLPGLRNQNLLQTLNLRTQGASVRENIANRVLQNRLSTLGLGSSLLGQERQFRLATSDRFSQGSQKTKAGGGIGDAFVGGAIGLGSDLQTAASLMGAPGGGNSGLSSLLSTQSANLGGGYTTNPMAFNPTFTPTQINTGDPLSIQAKYFNP